MWSVITAASFHQGLAADMRWREVLLEQAHTRIGKWHKDPSLLEAASTHNGITLRMLKQDLPCGGDMVPVTFAEFDVAGARPIDVFNTMLDTGVQHSWNPQIASALPIDKGKDQGARAWSVIFDMPVVSKRRFLQWQVADASFEKQEFWLVFSTQRNEELVQQSPLPAGAVESQNCLGAYHITQSSSGAHVVVTQQVNVHPFFPFPLHEILDFFPPAWQGTIDFVDQLNNNARHLASLGSSATHTDAPAFMLEAPPKSKDDRVSFRVVGRLHSEFPTLDQPKAVAQTRMAPLQGVLVILLIPACLLCVASLGFASGRCVAQRFPGVRSIQRQESVDLEDELAIE
jgi:hypothetical protein